SAGAAEDLVRERSHLQRMAVAALGQRKKDVAGVTGSGRDAGPRGPALDERLQFGLRHRLGDAILHPSDEIEAGGVTRPARVVCEAEWQPDLRVVVHEIRAGRHDADDLKPPSVNV